jgi:hypothetical protein
MNTHDPRGIYDVAVNILSDLAPDAMAVDPAQIVIHGNGSQLESIVLVNLILGLEEDLSVRSGIKIDLVELVASFDRALTLGDFVRELNARIPKYER